ncbi:MAG: hypothetical protein K0R92_3240 [Lachnospiraceae bacterium]|nr:hypothetical protein [Lachnospiraceae bacterium]
MKEKITLCGDNCIECPRYNAHSEEELKNVAELWYKVGWRDTVISNEEISCTGCQCEKIQEMLKLSAEYRRKCKAVCTEQEFIMLENAFFDKENNLKK